MTGNRLSSSTVELAFSLFVYLKCMYMSTYTVFAVFATQMTKMKYIFCQSPCSISLQDPTEKD